MEQLLILLLIGAGAVVKMLIERAQNKGSDAPPAAPMLPRRGPAPQTEEERMRKFLEALGMPSGSSPPPPVQPRRVPEPPPRRIPVPPPIPRPAAEVKPKPVELPREVIVVPPDALTPPTPTLIEAPSPLPAGAPNFRALLRSPETARTAILAAEILGPPKALQH